MHGTALCLSVCLSVSLSAVSVARISSQKVVDGFESNFCGIIDLRSRTNRLDFGIDSDGPGYRMDFSISLQKNGDGFLDIYSENCG